MPADSGASALAGKRVLITRAPQQAGDFAAAVSARGGVAVVAPAISIAPPDDPHRAHRAIDELARYAWVVFSSQNAVDAFFDRIEALDADARYLAGRKVAAIGSTTARRLRERGIRADLVPALYVGEELARALIEALRPGDRVLVFRAQEARDVLPRMLSDAGVACDVVAAYKTVVPYDPAFAANLAAADVVTFASASSVAGLLEQIGAGAPDAMRDKVVACIGPVTAGAAREAGLHVDVVAETSTAQGLLDALEAHLSQTA
ncbi:MAG TPA: uroporphyrinogen-III synthase [Candidatus Acidoferrales bacterium]|nr:uroporphyrinogen-III synthase [Candidatus Acidoferrales bacterium]